MEKYPQIEIEIELPSGGRIGTLKVFSDIGLVKDVDSYIKKVLEVSIQNCIDKLFYSGVSKISEEVKSL